MPGHMDMVSSYAMTLPTFGIEKIFNLPYKKEDFKIVYHAPLNMPVIPEAHKHDFFMLMMISHGSGIHTIDFKDYKVGNRMVFFLAPGQAHQWHMSPPASCYKKVRCGHFSLLLHIPF
jgi:AraC family transcriptional activator of pobA